MSATKTARGPAPLELPAGCRLAAEHMPDGRTYTVTLVPVESAGYGIGHVPATACGEFPKRPPVPRKAKTDDAPGLFSAAGIAPSRGPEPTIVVYAAAGHLNAAHAFANVLFRRGYNAEAKLESEAADAAR